MLELKNIQKQYNGRVVINEINITFPDSGLFFIVGDSGSGKTTLLNIMGMLDCRYSGKIILNKRELNPNNKQEMQTYHRETLGFIFQDYNLLDYLTVEENVKLSSTLANTKMDEPKYKEIIEHLNLQKVKNNMANELSGGEKQRVSIARILCRENSIILADEPTGNLDNENSRIIFETLTHLSKNKLIIVVTHNERAASEYGSGIIRISDGVIIEKTFEAKSETNIKSIVDRSTTQKNNNILKLMELTIKYLKFNQKKLISTVIMMIFCVTAIALFLSVFMSITNITTVINKSVLENDRLTITTKNKNNRSDPLSQQFLGAIENHQNIIHCVPYYEETVILSSTTNAEKIFGQYNVIDNNIIFDNRYDDLEGILPKKKNEIMITKTIVDTLFPNGDGLGKTITLTTMGDQVYQCKIVGYRTGNNQYSKGIYISKKLADEISGKLISMEYQTFSYENDNAYPGIYAVKIKNNEDGATDSYDMIYGRKIRDTNEIILDVTGVNEYLSYMGVKREYTSKELLHGNLKQKDLDLIFDNKICLSGTIENTRLADVHIVGIYTSPEEETDITFRINDKLIHELSTPNFTTLDIYVNSLNAKNMNSIYRLIDSYGYSYTTIVGDMGATISIKLSMMFQLLTIIMIFVIIVTIIMIHYATKVMLNNRIYEVGVLKSLGMKNHCVLVLFLMQNSFIGIISGLISCVLTATIVKMNLFTYENISLLSFNIIVCFLAVLGGLMICNLSGIQEMLKLSNKSVMECINQK